MTKTYYGLDTTQNNQVDNILSIPFEISMNTFELPSQSPHVQTNSNRTETRLHIPKCNSARVRHLQINPNHTRYLQKGEGVRDQT